MSPDRPECMSSKVHIKSLRNKSKTCRKRSELIAANRTMKSRNHESRIGTQFPANKARASLTHRC